jgi:hypothetical protein
VAPLPRPGYAVRAESLVTTARILGLACVSCQKDISGGGLSCAACRAPHHRDCFSARACCSLCGAAKPPVEFSLGVGGPPARPALRSWAVIGCAGLLLAFAGINVGRLRPGGEIERNRRLAQPTVAVPRESGRLVVRCPPESMAMTLRDAS